MRKTAISAILQILLYCVIVSAAAAAVIVLGSGAKSGPKTGPALESSENSAVPETGSSALTIPGTSAAPTTAADTAAFTTSASTTATAETTSTTAATTRATTATTAATKTTTAATKPQTEPPGPAFNHPELAGCSQVLLVTVENASTSYADITYYEKNGGIWKEVFSTKGRVGRNGIIPEEQRMQDTYKTPAGILKIIGAFGTSPDPGTAFDYIAVTGNMYWDLNSGSPTYNRLVYSDPGGQKEHLIEYGQKYGTYKYALITDYNYEQAAGKAARFLSTATVRAIRQAV